MDIRTAKNKEDKEKIFALRVRVFVEEQGVPAEIELDSEDADAVHIIAEDDGTAVGCARLILSENIAHIGRLAVEKNSRGKGVGKALVHFILGFCERGGYDNIWLNSQLHAARFYEKLGFIRSGDIFTEAGIEHIKMEIK